MTPGTASKPCCVSSRPPTQDVVRGWAAFAPDQRLALFDTAVGLANTGEWADLEEALRMEME